MARSLPATTVAAIDPAPPPSSDPCQDAMRQVLGNARSTVLTLDQAKARLDAIAAIAARVLAPLAKANEIYPDDVILPDDVIKG